MHTVPIGPIYKISHLLISLEPHGPSMLTLSMIGHIDKISILFFKTIFETFLKSQIIVEAIQNNEFL